jgi:signal transduction histidine kinase
MSASAHSFSRLPRDQELLGDLLHSLSQPLTSLRCSLELSIDEATEQQQQTVSAALQQTETVIGMIQLMREYLDAEQSAGQHAVALMPVLRSMAEDLSSIAALRNIRLRVVGTCAAKVRVAEPQLRLALQYLILAMIERQPAGSEITLLVAEGPAGAVLRAQGERRFLPPEASGLEKNSVNRQSKRDSVGATMRRVRLAIAGRVLETAGAELVLDDGAPGFVLRIPCPNAARASHLL